MSQEAAAGNASGAFAVTRRRVLTALPAGLVGLLAAPLAARDLPSGPKPWSYEGSIEAVHVPSGRPVIRGRVRASFHPYAYRRKPTSVIVELGSMQRDAGGWHKPSIYPHRTPWVRVDGDGRFETDVMSLSPPFGGSSYWEPARLEGQITERGRVMRGSFESPLVRGTFEATGLPQREAKALRRQRQIEQQRERWMRQNR